MLLRRTYGRRQRVTRHLGQVGKRIGAMALQAVTFLLRVAMLFAIVSGVGLAALGWRLAQGPIAIPPIPPLTEERRREYVKLAGKYAETQKIAVRNVRRDANEELKRAEKDGAISQDEQKRMNDEVQKLTDEAVKRVDEALKTKEQEIMQV